MYSNELLSVKPTTPGFSAKAALEMTMEINNSFSIPGPHSVRPAAKTKFAETQQLNETSSAENIFETRDELEISAEANWLGKVQNLPEIRADRVAELRSQIQSGQYDVDAKLDVALDRMLDEMA